MPKPRRPDAWVERGIMLRVLDVTSQGFDRIRRCFPADAMQLRGRAKLYHARRCLEAWAASTTACASQAGGGQPPARGELADLRIERERLRIRRETVDVEKAELEVRTRKGELLERPHVHAVYGCVATALRNAGLVLQRECGEKALRILREALARAKGEIEKL